MNENERPKKTRSSAYPAFTLEQAIDATKTLRTNLGMGPYSRESAAKAMGYSGITGSSATKIAACTYFGLLRREGTAYSQSDLADSILSYVTEEEKQLAIKEAFQKPTLYQKLVDDFDGRALPVMLENILARQHGIQERAAKEAASIFVKSAEFAGVLANGVLNIKGARQALASDVGSAEKSEGEESRRSERPSLEVLPPQASTFIAVPVPGTGITVHFPPEMGYHLSVGAFAESMKQLRTDADAIVVQQPLQTEGEEM